MRIYSNPLEAFRETERDLFEMGITVHPQTMQDKDIRDDPSYKTLETRGYAFKIVDWTLDLGHLKKTMVYFYKEQADDVLTYILAEFRERVSGKATNPGTSYTHRMELWMEFLHNGKFAYTYSERITPQLQTILQELKKNPESRQAIINIHSNICPESYTNSTTPRHPNYVVLKSNDLKNLGAGGRVPCSMYYQVMIREEKLDLIYVMRSADFLTHFPVDISIALCVQDWFADKLNLKTGTFTYFTGSLHAYAKDMKERGIF